MDKKTVFTLFNNALEKFPDKPYLCDKKDSGWQQTTFQETDSLSFSAAAGLISRGIKKQDKGVIISEGRTEWVIGELALLKAGAVSVPLSLKLQAEEIPFRVNHSDSAVLFFSHITWEKVLSVKKQFEREILFISLDDDPALLDKMIKAGGLEKGKNLLTFTELLEEGRSAPQEILDEVISRMEDAAEDDPVNICYTSGTTGNPKGILLTHKNYWTNVNQSVNVVHIPLNWRTLVILPIDHSYAHTVALYTAFLRCISLYFVDARKGAMSILRNIPINLTEVNPHFLLTVPAITGNFMKKINAGIQAKGGWIAGVFTKGLAAGIALYGNGIYKPDKRSIPNKGSYRLAKTLIFPKIRKIFGKNMQFCVGGGALLDIKQQEFFNCLGIPVYQGYGLTEATPVISSNSREKHKFGTSGIPVGNMEMKFIDSDGNPSPDGVKGQLCIKGGNTMKGYYKNEKATAEALQDGWLHTGDLGYMDEDGFLMIVGREKALLISGDGEKYSPEEIEETINNTADLVDQCMLYCDHKNYTTALLVPDYGKLKDLAKNNSGDEIISMIEESMNSYLGDPATKDKFPAHWRPSTFQLLEEPFTEANKMINSTMKMVRYKITEAYKDRLDYMYTSEGTKPLNQKNRDTIKKILEN